MGESAQSYVESTTVLSDDDDIEYDENPDEKLPLLKCETKIGAKKKCINGIYYMTRSHTTI